MLIIGSTAAKVWIPTFRNASDLDVWMLPHDFASWYDSNINNLVEFRPQRNPNKFFAKFRDQNSIITMEIRILDDAMPQMQFYRAQKHEQTIVIAGGEFKVASVKTLLKLKRSHIEFPLRWNKHINDYSELLEYYNVNQAECDAQQDNELLDSAYAALYKATRTKLGGKTAKLNMSNEQFFAKSAMVGRVYDHDSIHRAVMFYDQPMFEKIKDDLSSAMCSKRLWDKLSYKDKVRAVQEEAMVIALERKVIPSMLAGEPYDARAAFSWAIQRICTNLTSGWFRSFALDNWRNCMNLGFDFVARLDQKRLVTQ